MLDNKTIHYNLSSTKENKGIPFWSIREKDGRYQFKIPMRL